MTLEQLEREIFNLPPRDFRKLAEWMAERDQERWDRRLEEDVVAGKRDELLREPYWALKAQQALGEESSWPTPCDDAVKRRSK